MKEIWKLFLCYLYGHEYHWHYSEGGPRYASWFTCRKCGKHIFKHNNKEKELWGS